MRAFVWRTARVALNQSFPQVCRYISGRRFPHPRRAFHFSLSRYREDDPPTVPEATWNTVAENPTPLVEPHDSIQELENGAEGGDSAPQKPPRPGDRSYYGSGIKRANRSNGKKKETPTFRIPQWFMDRNVIIRESDAGKADEDGVGSQSQGQIINPTSVEEPPALDTLKIEPEATSKDSVTVTKPKTSTPAEELSEEGLPLEDQILAEISTLVSAGLQVPTTENMQSWRSPKPHIVLHCPKDGGSRYLDMLVKRMTGAHNTDLIRLDAQDLAQIGSDYLEDPNDSPAYTLSSLGYHAHLGTMSGGSQWVEDPADEEEYDDVEDDDDKGRPHINPFRRGSTSIIPLMTFGSNISDIIKKLPQSPPGGQPGSSTKMVKAAEKAAEKDLKINMFIETLLDACETKRKIEFGNARTNNSTTVPESKNLGPSGSVFVEHATESNSERGLLIVHIGDYPAINTTFHGGKILEKLHQIVTRRRKEGQRILIIGTTSCRDLIPSFSEEGFKSVQSQHAGGPTRTVITPFNISQLRLERDNKYRMTLINQRHLQDMLCHLASDPTLVSNVVSQEELDLATSAVFLSDMNESIWPLDRVHRAATVALGLLKDGEEMNTKHIEDSLALIELSDTKKFEWVAKENAEEKANKRSKTLESTTHGATMTSDESGERMKKLRRTCNKHEKKLLNGVIDPESIRTTFADVRAPPATIEALKTLTSLSLVRPDAFTYGVLATDRIPGLLLYGPPGTGKTLLAKAVAKESGATVLEVSGSDIYDMYVGEGEKNVKAIFSLAKKLTPCIVFIDEADAILGSRGGSSNRTSHRELINQFLREWDGMNDMSAFIMVATNRPFDLDEASLRRLPRRLLVDLPLEKDREEILKIHLKDEQLDPSVSLATLASQTPFYSGSDLKNLAVAAALACVREEFDLAASSTTTTTSTSSTPINRSAFPSTSSSQPTAIEHSPYPTKRTLDARHFKKAMEEISASVSEDMGSLSAIRKFDEKYGDRRGRRKKSGYGFLTVKESEKNQSNSARVRDQV